jgi:membrane-bound lytic murein transglycosylase D
MRLNEIRPAALLAAVGFMLTAGCSHTVTKPVAPIAPVEEPVAMIPLEPSQDEPADQTPAESAAEAIAEKDLFDRLRAGFQIADVDHAVVDRELGWYVNHPAYLDRTFRRGERYLYYIAGELEARKMPLELALLPIVESAFIPTALSHARAAGLWQFIPATGQRYGLKQSYYYDARRDVVESTRAALDYLQALANEFNGDWLLAIAAYNCGEQNVERALEKNQKRGKPLDFFSLDLPKETKAYVPKLLAMRRIVSDPAAHGLEFGEITNQPYFVKVDVGGQIDLGVAAELAGLNKDDLVALNPAYNRWVTDPDGPHGLLLPVECEQRFLQGLAELPPEKRVPVVYYRVRKGDTLASVARRYGVSPQELMQTNKLGSKKLHKGQELVLNANPTVMRANAREAAGAASFAAEDARSAPRHTHAAKYTVRHGDTLWSIARDHGLEPRTLAAYNSLDSGDTLMTGQKITIPASTATLASNAPELNVQRLTYTVRRGDTLARIAQTFKVEIADLLNWNKLTSKHAIKPGQRLVMYVNDNRRNGG